MGVVTAAIGGLVSKGIGAIGANQRKQKARGRVNAAENQLKELEANRQKIINPYEGYENISGLAENVSGMAKNAYAQLGVATQAAEFQAEEADLALANTLDTLRASGASAGGATALAQAALQSKKGVSASLEMQEAQNEKLKAQGEQRLNDLKLKVKRAPLKCLKRDTVQGKGKVAVAAQVPVRPIVVYYRAQDRRI